MAWVRKLPSGKWAATVRIPGGRKLTHTDPLKGAVQRWASEQEAAIRRGGWIDPRSGEITVEDWWRRTRDARHLEMASRRRDESHWRTYVAPRWGRTQLGAILKADVSAWVVQMQKASVGAASIEAAVGVLRGLLEMAVDERLIAGNPARGVRLPRRDAHVDRVLSVDEADALLDALDRHHPGVVCARLFCELLLDCGLRWGEAAALDREHVDMRRRLVHVGPVVERDGTVRAYPKSPAGVRPVPVGEHVWPRLRDLALTVPAKGLLFTSRAGRTLHYPNWRARIWLPALAGTSARGAVRGHRACVALPGAGLDDPQPTAHDLRHTYGTRLADNRVPPHEIMRLMGHSSLVATQRYTHAGEDRFDRARDALAAAREKRSRLTGGS